MAMDRIMSGQIRTRPWGLFVVLGSCTVGFGAPCPAIGSAGLIGRGSLGRTDQPGSRLAPDSARPVPEELSPVRVSQIRERAVAALLDASAGADPQGRANAIEGLLSAPSRAREVIAAGLRDQNTGVRSVAAMGAGRLRLTDLVPELKRLAGDDSPYVRASAIYALVRCLGEKQVDETPLARILLNDPSPRVRAQVAFILGELGNQSAVGLLKTAARADLPRALPVEVRLMNLQIAEALVKLGEDEQVQAIRAALYPARPDELELAALAVQIIGQVQDRGAIDQLIYLSEYTDQAGQKMPAEVRLAIAEALARLGLNQGAFIADEFRENQSAVLRAQAAHVYGAIGKMENLPTLEAMLDDEPIVRVSAAAAILDLLEADLQAQPKRE